MISDKKDVLKLMDYKRIPFKKKPPKFVRSKLYHYHFTIQEEPENWWYREEKAEYSPIISLNDPPGVQDYLKKIGILVPVQKSQKSTNVLLSSGLKFLRAQAANVPHHYLVWSISWMAVPILML